MHMLRASAMAVALLNAAPAFADEYFAVTPSGATETMFAEPVSDVVGKISSKCIDAHWSVVSSTASEVICEAPMNFGQSLMGTLLMGNSYSTPPRRFFKYNVATIAGVSRVQASGWMELQMAFGQVRRTEFSGPAFHNGAMNFMAAAGGKAPKGTTFPNHAFLGAGLEPVTGGKTFTMRVTSVEPGSAASRGGIQLGDEITSVAGKRFKESDDLLDALAKAAKAPSYPVEVNRAGTLTKLNIPRAYRPEITEQVVAAPAIPSPAAVAVAGASTMSVADELAKLGKLKADGLITQGEFDQQKAKLLAR